MIRVRCGRCDEAYYANEDHECRPVKPAAVVHKGRGEARYRDPESRRAYRRDWMRRKRAEARAAT
jgi:hypothetical protein